MNLVLVILTCVFASTSLVSLVFNLRWKNSLDTSKREISLISQALAQSQQVVVKLEQDAVDRQNMIIYLQQEVENLNRHCDSLINSHNILIESCNTFQESCDRMVVENLRLSQEFVVLAKSWTHFNESDDIDN